METAQLAVLAGFLGGAIGWIVRSLFDIFYMHRRDRNQIKRIVKADLMSISSISSSLQQKEFLIALERADKVDYGHLERKFILASIRDRKVDTRIIDRFGPDILKIEEDLLGEILNVYRQIVAVRLILNELFDYFERGKLTEARSLASTVIPLFSQAERMAKALCDKL